MPETEDGKWTFDWHAQPHTSFLSWLIPCLLVDEGKPYDKDEHEKLAQLTDSWRDIQLTVQINGVDVNPQHFIEGIERNMDLAVGEEAAELVRVTVDDIFEQLTFLQKDIESRIRQAFEEKGIPLRDREEW